MSTFHSDPEQRAARQYLTDSFHQYYYHHLGWDQNTWQGHQIKQCPFDLMVYQTLIFNLRPQSIVQTGVAGGGSMLYFAQLLDLQRASPEALVIGVDMNLSPEAKSLSHPRIRLLAGNSADPAVLEMVKALLPIGPRLVSLDSDHSAAHVGAELALYSPLLAPGDYLVVEDTNLNGNPVYRKFGPGPHEALRVFLSQNPHFHSRDALWQNHLFSFHTWLERVPEPEVETRS